MGRLVLWLSVPRLYRSISTLLTVLGRLVPCLFYYSRTSSNIPCKQFRYHPAPIPCIHHPFRFRETVTLHSLPVMYLLYHQPPRYVASIHGLASHLLIALFIYSVSRLFTTLVCDTTHNVIHVYHDIDVLSLVWINTRSNNIMRLVTLFKFGHIAGFLGPNTSYAVKDHA